MKTILITGGCGFIGSCFVRQAISRNYNVINLDALTYAGNLMNLVSIPVDEFTKKHQFINGNICNKELVRFIFKQYQPDYVVHFAAESHVDRSIEGADVFIKTNVNGTQTILEAMKESQIERAVMVSTDEVYGSLSLTDPSSVETDPIKARSPYSASKASADILSLAYHETYGLNLMITRGSNNFGPHQYPEKLIPRFITNLLTQKKVPLMGDGSNVRDWIYVEDHCEGIWTVLLKGEIGEIYNIGGSNEKTNREITDVILSAFNLDNSWIEVISHRLGHDFRYSLNTEKLQKLGWKPNRSFEENMGVTIDWYQKNHQWWKPLKDKAERKG